MRRHWLTTIFGFLLAFGTALTQAPGLRDNPTTRDLGGLIQTLSAVGLGAFAADARLRGNGDVEK